MEWPIALLAAAAGYLLGAISWARIIIKLVKPDTVLSGIELPGTEPDETFQMDAVSATALSIKLGGKWGGFTGILDILKVLVPTLVFRLVFPDTPYYLITAAMGMVGHNWPIYYRFKGGRGISAMYGGFLVVAPLGSIITSFAGMFIGLALQQILLSFMLGPWLMIPWVWWRTRDLTHVGYIVLANLLFVLAMIPDIRSILKYRREGRAADLMEAMEMIPQTQGMKKMGIRLGLIKEKNKE
jgi:glycerol-3-phosphate acyltransferase PlsY